MADRGKKADSRIVIVGAGPAGLATAYYLKQNGYRNVTVLEKLGRVGGLCRTITEDYQSFDLGVGDDLQVRPAAAGIEERLP